MAVVTPPDDRVDAPEAEPTDAPAEQAPVEGAPAEVEVATGTSLRVLLAVGCSTLAAAVMIGGVFSGAGGRIYAAAGGVLGLLVSARVAKSRKPVTVNLALGLGIFAIGIVLMLPSGPDSVLSLRAQLREAADSGNVLRPPVPLTPGWQAILGWAMGCVGFMAGWLALRLERPALGLLLPLPAAGIGGISVPAAAQVPSGIVVLILFAVGLGLLSGADAAGVEEGRTPRGYELRRALRAVPLLAVITVAMVLLARTDFLFPKPVFDPATEAQKPKTQPLSEVPDRVLFSVESPVSGPWRMGSLDTYDGKDWRLPPFADSRLKPVPRSGVVDEELPQAVTATFTLADLSGAVLPGLPNTAGVVARGPRLAYDSRNGNIRLVNGQVQPGFSYSVAAAGLPTVEQLRAAAPAVPSSLQPFLDMPPVPGPVQGLIDRAPKTSKWEEFDFLRNYVLENVVATGTGMPTSVPPDRVSDMLTGSKEGSPFEIVAAQAMLARWIGLPSRIGYGYDRGDLVGGKLEVRPKHGATFVEVWFPSFKWLPVLGTPKQAKPTVGTESTDPITRPEVLPSGEITAQMFLPVILPPEDRTTENLKRVLLVVVPSVLLLGLLYLLYPVARKSVVRSRRRAEAVAGGPLARIVLAYAEWRDLATDFGFPHPTDTPLMFVERFAPDAEHTQLAWLVTRAAFGDLRERLTPAHADAAEELSRALRRRLAAAQPATLRVVALLSRASLRRPYTPAFDRARKQKEHRAAA